MKGYLVVSENCKPCGDLKKEYAPLIQSGEIELVSLEEDPARVEQLMNKHGVGLPGLIVMGNNGQVIAVS